MFLKWVQLNKKKSVAGRALSKYQKTFKDLAKYDRGEKVLDEVPQ